MMVDATPILRPPTEKRVSRLVWNITLPRSVTYKQIGAGLAGLLIGLPLGMAIFGSFVAGMNTAMTLTAIFLALLYFSPLEGETMLTWLGLELRAYKERTVVVDGHRARAAVGLARLHRVAVGHVHAVPSAVRVNPDLYDERGVLRSEASHNLSSRLLVASMRDEDDELAG